MAVFASLMLACAVCGAAERSLPQNGAETAFEGRKRATTQLRAGSFAAKEDGLRVTELRAQPGFALAILPSTLAGVEVPLLRRSLSLGTQERNEAVLGDVELRVSYAAYKAIGRRFTIGAGTKLPTAPLDLDPRGRQVHPDLQPGCGSIVPTLEIGYAWSESIWSWSTSASLLFPISVREGGSHPGDSLRGSATMQIQPTRAFATRLGIHGRFDGTGEANGTVVKESGGASMHIAPEMVVSPWQDVVISAGASFPVVQAMRGYRSTSPVLLASVGVDF